jgi:DNA-binding NarL/FixJ family response regulator
MTNAAPRNDSGDGDRQSRDRRISLVIVDDEALVRGGFRMIVEHQPNLVVLAEAGTGEAAILAVRRHRPDVVLMDIRMPGVDGLEATRQLAADPAVRARILVLTTFDLDEYVFAALRAGASGFLLKDAEPARLIAAIRQVAAGETLLSPTVTRRLVERFISSAPAEPAMAKALASLTPRERDVLRLVARGLSNSEIAEHLVLSGATIKTHVAHLLGKLGLRDRTQLVVVAYEQGFVLPGGLGPEA